MRIIFNKLFLTLQNLTFTLPYIRTRAGMDQDDDPTCGGAAFDAASRRASPAVLLVPERGVRAGGIENDYMKDVICIVLCGHVYMCVRIATACVCCTGGVRTPPIRGEDDSVWGGNEMRVCTRKDRKLKSNTSRGTVLRTCIKYVNKNDRKKKRKTHHKLLYVPQLALLSMLTTPFFHLTSAFPQTWQPISHIHLPIWRSFHKRGGSNWRPFASHSNLPSDRNPLPARKITGRGANDRKVRFWGHCAATRVTQA